MDDGFEMTADLEEAIKKVVAARDEAKAAGVRAARANKKIVKMLGPELGKNYIALRGEVYRVHMNWAMSSELDVVTEDGEPRELLLDSGGYFFVELRTLFWDDAILRLSKLTDKAQQGPPNNPQHNLSLRALLDDINDPTLRSEVEKLIKEAEAKIEVMRIYRNKSIAHLDRDVTLNNQTSLPVLYPQYVDEALLAVGKVLDRLMEGYTGRTYMHEWGTEEAIADLEGLLYYLEAGLNRGGAKP